MNDSLEQLADKVLHENVKNIEMISYFKRSTEKCPVFLGVINKNYGEVSPLLKKGLIKDLEPIKSYIFNIDKFENAFYGKYQEKIDVRKEDIFRKKRKKKELTELTEDLTPKEESNDYDEKLKICLEFAKKTVLELDQMEREKENFNNMIAELQNEMQNDPYYHFLIFIRSDKEFIFNKRTEDNNRVIHKKVLNYLNKITEGKGWQMFNDLIKKGFYKEYSPAKNYYITKLGLLVDAKLKALKWNQDDEYEKNEAEIIQEEEIKKYKEIANLNS